MKTFLIWAILASSCLTRVHSETVDQLAERFLAGERIDQEMIESIEKLPPDVFQKTHRINSGTYYIFLVKLSLIDPVRHGGWPVRSDLVLADTKKQKKTYTELKAIYEKNRTPLVAYAMVCPAMYVDDMEILPELIAKIAENKPLKARFDEVYAKHWKPRLDPEL